MRADGFSLAGWSRPGRFWGPALQLVLIAGLAAGCGGGDQPPPPSADRAALLDSQSCQSCHPAQYREWASSMHAYASDDPVFQAMNKRGQRETKGALGDFCVKCHAPVALREGLTSDGLNLDQVPRTHKGVTCYFCHSTTQVTGTHNSALMLAGDGVMRGPIKDPIANPFHHSGYATTLDSARSEAAGACGSCHDIVNPKGTAIERTFAEWQDSLFAQTQNGLGCAGCHMPGRDEPAADTVTRVRRVHDHSMPGVDVALTPWPGIDDQKRQIAESLATAVQGTICLDERTNRIQVVMDNAGVGHSWPSGSAQDRRVWVEVVAYSQGQVIYQTGVLPEGGKLESLQEDPDLWMVRDCFFDESGKEVHMFWEPARYTSNLLPASAPFIPGMAPVLRGHYRWDLPRPESGKSLPVAPDRITMQVHLRPLGNEVIDELVRSGDLDPAVVANVPSFALGGGGKVEWTKAAVNFMYVDRGSPISCVAPPGFSPATMPAVSHARCPTPPLAPMP